MYGSLSVYDTCWPSPLQSLRNLLKPTNIYVYENDLEPREIRLIDLRYGEDDDQIQCRLVRHHLDVPNPDIKYVALSYVWGDPDDTAEILCDGQLLEIRENLHSLLRHIREFVEWEPHTTEFLWADAICINQANEEEKSQQIRLMQEIYRRADTVILWLGEETFDTRMGLEMIDRITKALYDHGSVDPETREHDIDMEDVMRDPQSFGIPGDDDVGWKAVYRILEDPLFTRVWIIQELLMARQAIFLCGLTLISADFLLPFAESFVDSEFYRRLRGQPWYYKQQNLSRIASVKTRLETGGNLGMLELLKAAVGFEATDPRDKVFALVGLAKDVNPSLIDYTKGTQEILITLALHILNQPRVDLSDLSGLEMLSFARAIPAAFEIPSWVPCWTSNDHDCFPLAQLYPTLGQNSQESPRITADAQNRLHLYGRICDRVQSVLGSNISYEEFNPGWLFIDGAMELPMFSSELNRLTDEFDRAEELMSQREQLIQSLKVYPTGESLEEVSWRSFNMNDAPPNSRYDDIDFKTYRMFQKHISLTLNALAGLEKLGLLRGFSLKFYGFAYSALFTCGYVVWAGSRWIMRGFHRPSLYEMRQGFFFWLALYLGIDVVCVTAGILYKLWKQRTVMYSIRKSEATRGTYRFSKTYEILLGRKFCSTSQGYVGWIPATAESGDEICFFNGCRLPFVIRAEGVEPHQKDVYRLVGDCYIHGIMQQDVSDAIDSKMREIVLA